MQGAHGRTEYLLGAMERPESDVVGIPGKDLGRDGMLPTNPVIGPTAKNAILIIEVAKKLVTNGRSVRETALEAGVLRFLPTV